MRIGAVYLRDFEPFADQHVEFSPKASPSLAEVHFFVGQNGTGKTRLLSLLAAACGNPKELQYRTSTFRSRVFGISKKAGEERYVYYSQSNATVVRTDGPLDRLYEIAKKETTDKSATAALAPTDLTFGIAFRSVPSLQDTKVSPMAEVKWGDPSSFLTFTHHSNESVQICQSLANLKVRMGIVSSDPSDRTVRMMKAFDDTIKYITGQNLLLTVGYVDQEFRLKVSWAGKDVQLKQLPDGLRSIVGWLASCVTKLDAFYPEDPNPLEKQLILILDEPDAHLHPAWQRKLIPAVQRLLPNAQIFVATHSPFVISSVSEGWIYVFEAGVDGKVKVKPGVPCSPGDSYIDVVEDVLGIKEQFDPETEKMLAEFRVKREAVKREPNETAFSEVRALGEKIAKRSETLSLLIGRELTQLDAQLRKQAV